MPTPSLIAGLEVVEHVAEGDRQTASLHTCLAHSANPTSNLSADELLLLLGHQDSYEAAMWVDILRSRVEAIGQFKNLTRADRSRGRLVACRRTIG